jgi:putrescine transport system permease protein
MGLQRGFWTVAVSHATMTLCYATVVIQARLVSFDKALEEAAQDLGCPPIRAFFLVTLPGIAPAVAAAWMLAFTLSLDDLVIASFTSGPGSTTLPMRIYSQVRLEVNPEINAVSTLLIAIVTLGVCVATLIQRRPKAAQRG